MQNLTKNKWIAVRSLINVWLKDKTIYCNACGALYDPKNVTPEGHWHKCCDEPQIGRNIDHCYGVVKQNKELQKMLTNDTAMGETKAMRWGVSIPQGLLLHLEKYFKEKHKEKLFNDTKELNEFMREFPAFRVAKKV